MQLAVRRTVWASHVSLGLQASLSGPMEELGNESSPGI